MRILHAKDEATGAPIENAFVAMEGYDTVLGECQVEARSYPALLPERPHIVDIAAKGSSEALDALYGAGTALAQLLSRRSRQNSEIRIECGEAQRERLRALGYRERDALVRMRRKHRASPMIERLPAKCTIVFDQLTDPYEARYFIERYNTLFAREDGMAQLKEMQAKDGFSRTVMVAPDGLAGEMLAWLEEGEGVIGYLYTAPAFRRQGVARYLLDLARSYFLDAGLQESRMDVWQRLLPAMQAASAAGFRPAQVLKEYAAIDIDWEE